MAESAVLNGVPYSIQPGETVLAFAQRALGAEAIPTLCDEPRLKPFGACRVCSVEIAPNEEGARRVAAACHTPVTPNAHIFTDSARVQRLRKNIIELVVSDHPLECLTCEVNGNCQLQSVASRVGLTEVRYPTGATHLDRPNDASHPYLRADWSKCINCQRCVRACDEIQGQQALGVEGRGFAAKIVVGADSCFNQSDCVSCGACVQSCPTAALGDRFNSKTGADLERVRTTCGYCGVGCQLEVAVEGEKIHSIRAPWDAEVNEGHTCLKGRYAFGFVRHPDRLTQPLLRKEGELQPVGWDEAFDFLTDRLKGILASDGPDALAGVSSSRCVNEENYLMQKMVRVAWGTNNIDGCARVCHAPTAFGMQQSFGTGAATNSIEDLAHTDFMMLIGANPLDAHPVTGSKILQKALGGTRLAVLDPRKTRLAAMADHHLQLKPGTNAAVLNLMARFIIDEGLVDRGFIESRCEGWEEYQQEIAALDVDASVEACGVDREVIRDAALAYARSKRAMMFHGLGVTEQQQGSRVVRAICNLAMMTGQIGEVGMGVNPLRGQNNVQGAADMGVQPHQGAGYLDITDPEARVHYANEYGREVPGEVGWKIPEMLEAALEGKLKGMWIMGECLVQTDPNSEKVKAALGALDLLIVQEIFMTPTAELADLVLPAASFFEKEGTFTNGERRIQRVNPVVPPPEGVRSDGAILAEAMNRLGYPQPAYDAREVLAEIARVVPFFKGVTWERLGENGLQWPVDETGAGTKILHQESFKRGKGAFRFEAYEESREWADNRDRFPFLLSTGRNLEHYNTGTMTRRTPNRELRTTDKLWIHPDDAKGKGIAEGAQVRISNDRGAVELAAEITEAVKPGILYTTFHFPELEVNRIIGDGADRESLCPEYKVTAVSLEPVG